ncbi:hypothetical protein NC652_010566 [Populus alba x Populus x berolinensis]|nr:hypothetical protein NC652_010566 [Populus alba x Populus x berolinensis]
MGDYGDMCLIYVSGRNIYGMLVHMLKRLGDTLTSPFDAPLLSLSFSSGSELHYLSSKEIKPPIVSILIFISLLSHFFSYIHYLTTTYEEVVGKVLEGVDNIDGDVVHG